MAFCYSFLQLTVTVPRPKSRFCFSKAFGILPHASWHIDPQQDEPSEIRQRNPPDPFPSLWWFKKKKKKAAKNKTKFDQIKGKNRRKFSGIKNSYVSKAAGDGGGTTATIAGHPKEVAPRVKRHHERQTRRPHGDHGVMQAIPKSTDQILTKELLKTYEP